MLDWLVNKIFLFGNWSYCLIFISAALETAAFLGFLIPGETIVIFSGFLASQGVLDLEDCMWVIALGAIVGDSIGYELGRHMGQTYFEKHNHFFLLKKHHLQQAQQYFHKHGGKTIFLGRFFGFLRAFAPLIAGMSKMSYRIFLYYNILGGILWTMTFTLLGYFFGHSWKVIESWAGKVGLLLFLFILLVGGGVYVTKQFLLKQGALFFWIKHKWTTLIELPTVKNFFEVHPNVVQFLKNRISAKNYLGLHLTIGLTISAVFVRILAELTENVLEHGPLVQFDQWVLSKTQYLHSSSVNQIMSLITFLGDKKTLTLLTLLTVLVLLVRHSFLNAVVVTSAMVGGSILGQVIKFSIHRERPIAEHQLIEATGFSFPSGHSMMSAIFYGLMIYFVLKSRFNSRITMVLIAFLGALIFLIGLSRIYLEVHYLSDVLAGFVGGIFYLVLCITGAEVYSMKIHLDKNTSFN